MNDEAASGIMDENSASSGSNLLKKNLKAMELSLKSSDTLTTGKSLSSCKDVELFKLPVAPPLKKKRIVLEEDKYSEELEKIVQRDFFPDLEKLKAQNAYLSALENNDIHMLRELYSKYSLGKNTPRLGSSRTDTPSTFETPVGPTSTATPAENPGATPTHLPMEKDDDSESVSSSASKSKAKNMSLNDYLNTYTSEDNQSFQEIMEESDRKHRLRYSWLFEAENKHAEQLKQSALVPSIQEQAGEYKRPLNIDTWNYKNQNYLMYVPDGVAFTPEEEVEMAKKKPEVVLKNTRFDGNPYKQEQVQSEGGNAPKIFKIPEGKIGLDGKEIESSTPKVNSYGYVRTPSPSPGVEESPFMTWGEIEGTPFRLDGSDTPVPATQAKPFRMLNTSKREKLALELAEKVSQGYRDRKQKAIEAARYNLASPSPRPTTSSSLDRLLTMSPAAQKFAKSHLAGRLLPSDKALRESYTPKKPTTPRDLRTPSSALRSTPSKTPTPFSKSEEALTPSTSSTSITDNLLKLPTSSRPRASDFF